MDEYLIKINQMKEDLNILEQEESELERAVQIAQDKVSKLYNDYSSLDMQQYDLQIELNKAINLPKRLNIKKTEHLLENITFFLVLCTFVWVNFGMSTVGIALDILAAVITGAGYMVSTRKIKEELKQFKNIDRDTINEQIEEAGKIKRGKDNEIVLAKEDKFKVEKELQSVRKKIRILKQEVVNVKVKSNHKSDEIENSLLEPKTPVDKKPIIKTLIPKITNNNN